MPIYQSVTTTTVDNTSTSIISGIASGADVEVVAKDAGIYVHVTGGTASVGGDNCVYVPQNGFVVIRVEGSTTALTAIRESSTDAEVTTAVIS